MDAEDGSLNERVEGVYIFVEMVLFPLSLSDSAVWSCFFLALLIMSVMLLVLVRMHVGLPVSMPWGRHNGCKDSRGGGQQSTLAGWLKPRIPLSCTYMGKR